MNKDCEKANYGGRNSEVEGRSDKAEEMKRRVAEMRACGHGRDRQQCRARNRLKACDGITGSVSATARGAIVHAV